MSRQSEKHRWARSISMAVLVALLAACSKPPQNTEDNAAAVAAAVEELAATSTPAPATPAAPPPPPSAPPTEDAPTPAETPVEPPDPAPDTPAPKGSTEDAAPDPLKLMQEAEARRQEYETHLAKLAAERDAARDRAAQAERDALALKNPYLARPVLNKDETAAIQGLNGAERAQWAQSRLADAIEALKAAQSAYDDAKANPPN